MGRSKESFHGFFIQCIGVGLIIKPGAFSRYFQVGKPFVTAVFARLIFRNSLVGGKVSLFQAYLIFAKKSTFCASLGLAAVRNMVGRMIFSFYFFRGEKEKTGTMAVIFCDQASGKSGWPAILIIEPGEKAQFVAFLMTVSDQFHEFFSKIGSIKAGPAMQVSAAHAHIFHGFQRIVDSFPGHFTIP